MTEPSPKKTAKLTFAARLLVRLLDQGVFTREQAANMLIVPVQMLDEFVSGALTLPLDRQIALATLIIERVPALAREGHRLRGQAEAAIAYESGQTETHSNNSRRTNYW